MSNTDDTTGKNEKFFVSLREWLKLSITPSDLYKEFKNFVDYLPTLKKNAENLIPSHWQVGK